MRVLMNFAPANDQERAALQLLGIKAKPDLEWEFTSWGEPERQHRILGALIDILKLSIVP